MIRTTHAALRWGPLMLGMGMVGLASGAAQGQQAAPPQVVQRICSGCHGMDGTFGWAQVPRLAGQNAAYLEKQMAAFRRAAVPSRVQVPTWLVAPPAPVADSRTEPQALTFMVGIARRVSPSEAAAAAAWYASRPPARGTASDDAALLAAGKALFEEGVPVKGVVACRDCHGAQAQGLAEFPRLAGQQADYLVRQLQALKGGRRADAPAMQVQAKNLDVDQMRALAVYLQSL